MSANIQKESIATTSKAKRAPRKKKRDAQSSKEIRNTAIVDCLIGCNRFLQRLTAAAVNGDKTLDFYFGYDVNVCKHCKPVVDLMTSLDVKSHDGIKARNTSGSISNLRGTLEITPLTITVHEELCREIAPYYKEFVDTFKSTFDCSIPSPWYSAYEFAARVRHAWNAPLILEKADRLAELLDVISERFYSKDDGDQGLVPADLEYLAIIKNYIGKEINDQNDLIPILGLSSKKPESARGTVSKFIKRLRLFRNEDREAFAKECPQLITIMNRHDANEDKPVRPSSK